MAILCPASLDDFASSDFSYDSLIAREALRARQTAAAGTGAQLLSRARHERRFRNEDCS
jgi:hypothetical protein